MRGQRIIVQAATTTWAKFEVRGEFDKASAHSVSGSDKELAAFNLFPRVFHEVRNCTIAPKRV